MSPNRTSEKPLDSDLLSEVARGDAQAYATLYHRYAAILLGLLARILGSRTEAEDVLQEVFLQIWRRAGDFDEGRGRPFQWLTMIARSRALDRRAALESRNRLMATEASRRVPDLPPDPSEEASLAEEARLVRRLLEQIPESQRHVLLLAYFEGLSQSEIAARIGAPLGTVKSHARLGLIRLRALLGSGLEEQEEKNRA